MARQQALHKWLVSGVGRSGTTALYEALQHVARNMEADFQYFYEPYLWGEAVWTENREAARGKFNSTDSMNAWGLVTHLSTPLFLGEAATDKYELHDRFVETLYGAEKNTLAKVIRGSGRLGAFCRQVPDLRIVHITRNPLDTINSVVGQFSFFGEEFHPSDKERFFREAKIALNKNMQELSDVQRAAHWWSAMNDAAFETARAFPEQILVIANEEFVHDPRVVMKQVLQFLGAPVTDLERIDFEAPVGPVTKKLNLKSADVEYLGDLTQKYFEGIYETQIKVPGFDAYECFERVAKKYSNVREGEFVPDIARDASPLIVRRLSRERAERLIGIQNYLGRLLTESRWALRRTNRNIEQTQANVATDFEKLTRDPVLGCARRLSKGLTKRIDRVERNISLLRSEPSIACIITSYNNGGLLRRAVNSVLSQGLVPKEIIITDDGSTGPSLELAQKIASEYDFIRLIQREQNLGPGGNRHQAILDARCAFITTLDGDDEFAPRKIGAEWNAINERLNRVTFSRVYQVFKGEGAKVVAREFQDYQNFSKRRRLATIFDRSRYLPRDMMFSKQAYVESGGYETSSQIYEDWSLKMRLANVIEDWRYSKVTGTLYHKAAGGLSQVSGNCHVFWKLYALGKNANWAIEELAPEQLREAVVRAVDLHESEDFKARFEVAAIALNTRFGLREFFKEFEGNLGQREWRGTAQQDLDGVLARTLTVLEQLAAANSERAKPA